MEKDTSLERLAAAICPIVLDALRGLAAHPEDRDAAWEMEGNVLSSIMGAAAAAYAQALEEMDRELCASLPEGMHVHDIRTRMVATRLGDVSFRRRRCTDRAGNVDAPLDALMGLAPSARISPGLEAELVWLAAQASYQHAADAAAYTGSSAVSRDAVMRCVRRAGRACEADDRGRELGLWQDGVVPEGRISSGTLCVEPDGTVVALQHAGGRRHLEIKAMTAYRGKERHGRKNLRLDPVSFGCAGTPDELWRQGIAAVGSVYRLDAVEEVHSGFDGASWCSGGLGWLGAIGCDAVGHMDPFHVDRAVSACFGREHEEERPQAMRLIYGGDAEGCAGLLERMAGEGTAKADIAPGVIRYLRSHADRIGVPGPSLGTMESENQHVYKSRMAGVPCAWSMQGASDMARIRSRQASGRPIPHLPRDERRGPKRLERRKRKEIAAYSGGPAAGDALAFEGKGYEYPVRGSVEMLGAEVRFRSEGWLGIPEACLPTKD